MVITVHDITRQKQAERALAETKMHGNVTP